MKVLKTYTPELVGGLAGAILFSFWIDPQTPDAYFRTLAISMLILSAVIFFVRRFLRNFESQTRED